MVIVLFLVIFTCTYHQAESTCTLPSYLDGVWESPEKGNLTFNSTHLEGYDVFTYTGLTFECHLSSGSKYVLRSDDFTVLGGNVVNAAICFNPKKASSKKVTYYILSSELADADYERVVFVASSRNDLTVDEICDDTSVSDTAQNTKLLIKYGFASSETVRCPNDILGTYWYYNNTACSESSLDVCTTKDTLEFNVTLCADTQVFSTNGSAYCVYKKKTSSKQEMVYVYNTDDTVDETTTFRFTCMVIKKMKDKLVYVTQNPKECYGNQTATYVVGDGTSLVLSANKTCVPSTDEESSVAQAGLIAGLVILFLVLIVAGAVGGYYLYMKKFKKVDPAGERIIDKEKNGVPDDSRGLEPVTPSVVNTELNDTKSPHNGGSHGKLKQVLGPEYTMTNNASDDSKAGNDVGNDVEMEDMESPRKLPPIMTGNTPRDALSPLDTQLKKPALPGIP